MKLGYLFTLLTLSSCLSFKGVIIPTEVKSYFVPVTIVETPNAPAEISQIFSEALRLKVREQSRLVYDENDPHVIFTPILKKYQVNAVAPQPGNTVAFNRLDISVKIEYENIFDEEDNYAKNFNAFMDFEASNNLEDVEDDLIIEIFEDITERVFNDTFSDW